MTVGIGKQVQEARTMDAAGAWPSNDNRYTPLSMGQSIFPSDAVARIFKPTRSVMTSGRARTKAWRLVFERSSPSFIEPLMGYTGSRDTLAQVELEFPTLETAVRYAERQGLNYIVETQTGKPAERATQRPPKSTHIFSDATLERLGLKFLQESYGRALDEAANRNDAAGPEGWASPMNIVDDPTLTLEAKRAILMNWAWTEFLIDQATNEGMPENDRPSRLDEVEQALLTLERKVAGRHARPEANRRAA